MSQHHSEQAPRVAHAVRTACEDAARRAYEEALMSGLCCEGAWEAALGAIRSLNLEAVLQRSGTPDR